MAERLTGHTELIGLMAYPIRHSSSPAMHNEAFAYLGLDYAYLAFEVDNSTLEDAVKGLRALKMVGSNVSMPNKTVVGKYLDKLSPAAELVGAVNTIVNKNGVLEGHITDGIGYMASLKDKEHQTGCSAKNGAMLIYDEPLNAQQAEDKRSTEEERWEIRQKSPQITLIVFSSGSIHGSSWQYLMPSSCFPLKQSRTL